jgi:hypothetical protein
MVGKRKRSMLSNPPPRVGMHSLSLPLLHSISGERLWQIWSFILCGVFASIQIC